MMRQVAWVLAILILAGCGDAGETTEDTEPEPFVCEPRPAEELEDCFIDVGRELGDDRLIETREQLQQVCESKCTRFEGSLTLQALPGVTDLTALQNVRSMEGLLVSGTEDLVSLRGLETVDLSSNGTFSPIAFERNQSLETLEGLNLPTTLDATEAVPQWPVLQIRDNPNLKSLKGLDTLEEVYDVDISITENPSLESLEGLRNLRVIGGEIAINVDRNLNLKSLDLDSLETTPGIYATDNPKLTDLRLDNLQTARGLVFKDNDSLPACLVDELQDRVQAPEFYTNSGNDTSATCE